MYSHTKKVGSMGRYGPRVGRKIRHEARKIEDELNKPRNCPRCGKTGVKRKVVGIWVCRSCKLVYAGGAYMPHAVKKTVEVVEQKHARPEVKKQSKVKQEKKPEEKIETMEAPVEEKPRVRKTKAKKSDKKESKSEE